MSKELDAQNSQKARTFFQYGNDAVLKSNFDYAVEMYQQACKLAPRNLMYRQALRSAQRKRFNDDPGKVGMLAGARNQPIRLRARAARSKGNYLYALELCEDAFTHNPWDVATAREASQAAELLGDMPLAEWLLESVQAQANDADFFRHAAAVYERNQRWNKAIASWEQVKRLDPTDENASRQINALSASATIKRAKLDQALERRAQAQEDSTVDTESQRERVRREQASPEERWKREIQEDPTAVWPYLNLAEHYRHRGELEAAEKVLAQGIKAHPKDSVLLQAYADVQIGRLKRAIESWAQRHQEHPEDAAAKAKLDQLTKLLSDYEIKEYRRRLSLSPDDANLHFQLGLCLARAGQHDEAIAAFQQARSNPSLKVQSLYHAGLSFEANGALKLADRAYRDALKAIEPEDTANFNALHYRLGRVAEALGNLEAAEEHYNEVAANDYTYLDVAQRLKNLN